MDRRLPRPSPRDAREKRWSNAPESSERTSRASSMRWRRREVQLGTSSDRPLDHRRRDRVHVDFAGAYAVDLLDGDDEDDAVADLAGARSLHQDLHGDVDERLRDADVETDLFVELHLGGRAAVIRHLDDLAAVPLRAADRQAAHVGLEERLEHVCELFRPDDRGDDLHRSPPSSDRTRIAPSPLPYASSPCSQT